MPNPTLPPLPHSWSELSWQQLCACWSVKMRYGGNADVARVAALLALLDMPICQAVSVTNNGETLYRLHDTDGCQWTVTAREASYLAKEALPWFDFPYGDSGEKEERDEKGKVIKEQREPVSGYVCPDWKDAMCLPIEILKTDHCRFYLPQVACNNVTWHQFRSLQAIVTQLFQDGVSEEHTLSLQAQFLAHCLVPRSLALLDSSGKTIKFRPHYVYEYDAEQAGRLVKYWHKRLDKEDDIVLFHACFQVYQTALSYYAKSYPMLFEKSGKDDHLRDALTGEVGIINTIMKYAGYAEQQQVYDSNLPFVFDILNTMTKEALEIESMNRRVKK